MKPIFFIDYDNTIFSHQTWQIPESTLCALEQLQKDGYKLVIASGRAFRNNSLPEEFQGRITPDCLVSANGAIVEIEGKLVKEFNSISDACRYGKTIGLSYSSLGKYFTSNGYKIILNKGATTIP